VSASDLQRELPGGGRVLFTSRAHGNLSPSPSGDDASVGGDGAEHGERARESLREQLGLRSLARGYQVHGTVVRRVDGSEPSDPDPDVGVLVEADGQATAAAGVGAMVLSADCLPVALGRDGAVAMVHAGWRGLAAGVLEEGVRAVGELGKGGEIVAIVGPCAGVCCYEVGPEVHHAFAGAHREGDRIDLRAIAHERLLAAGVAEVRDVLACTICDERFFSHRREGERAGRQAGVAWLS
jgi:purine-nucleoside/S-methyl-5'-thioadenosine phosphorylase / adenosine deaminase